MGLWVFTMTLFPKPRTHNTKPTTMLKYFWSKEFLYSILGLIVAGFLLYLLVFFVILPSYTRHGDSVLVPDVGNLSEAEAIKVLDEADLRYEVKDSVYEPSFQPRVILDQYPAPLSRVKPDRKVFLTVSKVQPPLVELPALKGLQFSRAREILKGRKLIVGKKIKKPVANAYNDEVTKAFFEGQEVKPGTKIPQGSVVDLEVLESTRREEVVLPNLVGLTLEDAISALRAVDLNVGAIVPGEGGAPDQQGLVFRQNPPFVFERRLKVGSTVDIYVYGELPE